MAKRYRLLAVQLGISHDDIPLKVTLRHKFRVFEIVAGCLGIVGRKVTAVNLETGLFSEDIKQVQLSITEAALMVRYLVWEREKRNDPQGRRREDG